MIYYPSNSIVEAVVMKDSKNVFHITLKSAWFCPRECIDENGHGLGVSVCSGHGMCIEDMFVGYPHCACDYDNATDFCSDSATANPFGSSSADGMGPNYKGSSEESWIVKTYDYHPWIVVVGIMACVLVLICLIAAVILFVHSRKVKQMKDQYAEMNGFIS